MKVYIIVIISLFFLVGCLQVNPDQTSDNSIQTNFITTNQNEQIKVDFLQVMNSSIEDGFYVELLITDLQTNSLLEQDIWFNPISSVKGKNKIQYNSRYMHIVRTENEYQLIHKELFEPTLYNNTDSLTFNYSVSQKYSIDTITFSHASNEQNVLTNDLFTVERLNISDEKLQFILSANQVITELNENLEVVLLMNNEEIFPLFSNVRTLNETSEQIVFDLTFAMALPKEINFSIRFQQSPLIVTTFVFNVPIAIDQND